MIALRTTYEVFRRELASLFVSPIAYLVLFFFLLINGVTFWFYIQVSGGNLEVLLNSQYSSITFWFLSLLIPPLLTMRTLAEEQRQGTYESLITTGVSETSLVVAKFAACWLFFAILWASLLPPYFLLEWQAADLDWGMIGCVHGGVLLVGALFTAIGIFASSFTKNQLVAASAAVILNLFVFFVHYFRFLYDAGDYELRYFQYISPLAHFGEDFTRGVFDYRYVTLYLSFAVLFLFMGVKSLERRRWW